MDCSNCLFFSSSSKGGLITREKVSAWCDMGTPILVVKLGNGYGFYPGRPYNDVDEPLSNSSLPENTWYKIHAHVCPNFRD